jgi:HK97 family phage portal protein
VLGVSRLRRAAGALGLGLELQNASSTFLGNAARPAGSLTSERPINDAQAARFKQDFEAGFERGQRGKITVLGGGVKFETFSLMSAEDAQIVAHRTFTVADCSRILGVPLSMLGDAHRATFASAREASRQFAVQSLSPWVAKLQRAFQQSVLSSQFRLVIDLGDLLRADPEARWASWQRARLAGVLSKNDIRGEENWPPSSDPSANSIAPPNTSAPIEDDTAPPPPAPDSEDPADDTVEGEVARLPRRALHASD